jgi:hypothetical protein
VRGAGGMGEGHSERSRRPHHSVAGIERYVLVWVASNEESGLGQERCWRTPIHQPLYWLSLYEKQR